MAGRLDQTRPFLPVNIALLTVSDTRSMADDRSGNALAEMAEKAGHRITGPAIVEHSATTFAIPPGRAARLDAHGIFHMTSGGG